MPWLFDSTGSYAERLWQQEDSDATVKNPQNH